MTPLNRLSKPGKLLLLWCSLPSMMQGCASSATEAPVVVNVKPGNYCDIAQKVEWSIQDTRPTIDAARKEAAKIDRLCKTRVSG